MERARVAMEHGAGNVAPVDFGQGSLENQRKAAICRTQIVDLSTCLEDVMAKTAKETKEKLIKDFRSVISDTEELMKFVSNEGGGKAQALREKIDDNLKGAKEYLQNIEGAVVDKSRVAARVTDDYVHENAWRTIGLAVGVGILIGLLMRDRE